VDSPVNREPDTRERRPSDLSRAAGGSHERHDAGSPQGALGAQKVTLDRSLSDLARSLEGKRIRYCVLHDWDLREVRPGSDIDLAVAAADLRPFVRALDSSFPGAVVQVIHYESSGYVLIMGRRKGSSAGFVAFDAATDYRRQGLIHLSGDDLLRHRRNSSNLWVASPEAEFRYLLVKVICKQTLPGASRQRLGELHAALADHSKDTAQELLGARCGKKVTGWISAADWTAFERHLRKLRRALRWRSLLTRPLYPICYWGAELARVQRRWRYPNGLSIAVLGSDGAGKTTLVEGLKRELAGGFRQVQSFRLRPDLLHRNRTGPEPNPHGIPPRSRWLSILKVLYLLADYRLGHLLKIRPKLVRSDLVIFDRYYHDIFVDPRRYRYGGPRWLTRLAGHFIPTPDIALIMVAPPEQLLARKSEIPREELLFQGPRYRRLALQLGNAVLLDASLPAAEVLSKARDACLQYMHARYRKRRHLWFGKRLEDGSIMGSAREG
jgi:thymidylate kinase